MLTFMHRFLCLTFILIGLFGGSVLSQETVSKDQDLFQFSRIMAGLEFQTRHDYDEPGLGYSLRYENDEEFKADIYIYDMGHSHLPDGIESPEIKEAMASVVEGMEGMVKQGRYADLKELASGTRRSTPGGIPFLYSRHSYRQVGEAAEGYDGVRLSETYLTIRKGKFVKVRITTKAEKAVGMELEISRFINQMAVALE